MNFREFLGESGNKAEKILGSMLSYNSDDDYYMPMYALYKDLDSAGLLSSSSTTKKVKYALDHADEAIEELSNSEWDDTKWDELVDRCKLSHGSVVNFYYDEGYNDSATIDFAESYFGLDVVRGSHLERVTDTKTVRSNDGGMDLGEIVDQKKLAARFAKGEIDDFQAYLLLDRRLFSDACKEYMENFMTVRILKSKISFESNLGAIELNRKTGKFNYRINSHIKEVVEDSYMDDIFINAELSKKEKKTSPEDAKDIIRDALS